ncbi:MAG: hypothetical protein IPJ65_27285 [Archangiaceae bacterium]|nr:hypothetical protein [Archangiaceae bacterium]
MELGERGWLREVLTRTVNAHVRDETSTAATKSAALPTPKARANAYLRLALRESGLLYGTPSKTEGEATGAAEERLFLAVLQALSRIGLDLAYRLQAAPGPRVEQLLLLFAAMAGELDDAEAIHKSIENASKKKGWPPPEKLWRRVEEALEARAMSLSGDPYYGLVLHNGALFSDAHLFGRLALSYFSSATFSREASDRRIRFAAQQKALLAEVLIGLACAERRPSFPARRAILRQIEDLKLPDDVFSVLHAFARRAFERPPSLERVLKTVRTHAVKRFIVEQALLASLVDGRRSPKEREFLSALAQQLGISAEERKGLELEVAEFYAKHRDVVDVFTVAAGAEVMGEELVDSMQATLEKNFQALLKEVRETGELSVLLARAARGQKLTREEKRRMRDQLLDVARAVPALAIFAAPGGVLLLIALAKVLPFSLLPSSFRDARRAALRRVVESDGSRNRRTNLGEDPLSLI